MSYTYGANGSYYKQIYEKVEIEKLTDTPVPKFTVDKVTGIKCPPGTYYRGDDKLQKPFTKNWDCGIGIDEKKPRCPDKISDNACRCVCVPYTTQPTQSKQPKCPTCPKQPKQPKCPTCPTCPSLPTQPKQLTCPTQPTQQTINNIYTDIKTNNIVNINNYSPSPDKDFGYISFGPKPSSTDYKLWMNIDNNKKPTLWFIYNSDADYIHCESFTKSDDLLITSILYSFTIGRLKKRKNNIEKDCTELEINHISNRLIVIPTIYCNNIKYTFNDINKPIEGQTFNHIIYPKIKIAYRNLFIPKDTNFSLGFQLKLNDNTEGDSTILEENCKYNIYYSPYIVLHTGTGILN